MIGCVICLTSNHSGSGRVYSGGWVNGAAFGHGSELVALPDGTTETYTGLCVNVKMCVCVRACVQTERVGDIFYDTNHRAVE